MTYRCLLAALVSGALLFSLAGCDDSSTVGLGVGSDSLSGGEPETVNAFPSVFEAESDTDAPITSSVTSTNSGYRFLSGSVTDPVVGTITTRGHIDFGQPATASSVASILSVDLILEPEYRYGSTTDQQTITVHDAVDEIISGLPSDTTALGVGAEITSASFTSSDTLVTVPLPDTWVTTNGPTLLNASDDTENGYDATFNGVVLVPESGNHVMGFDRAGSRLRVIAELDDGEQDTLDYIGSKSFTYIERTGTPNVPATSELLVDGVGTRLATTIDFNDALFEELGPVPVNRAEFVIPVDSAALSATQPVDFTRPEAGALLLRGELPDARTEPSDFFQGRNQTCTRLGLTTFQESCIFTITETDNGYLVSPPEFQRVVEESLREPDTLFTQFVLSFSGAQPSITPLLLRRPNPDNPDGSTRLQLTLVPQR